MRVSGQGQGPAPATANRIARVGNQPPHGLRKNRYHLGRQRYFVGKQLLREPLRDPSPLTEIAGTAYHSAASRTGSQGRGT
jgi:hypothetical protein